MADDIGFKITILEGVRKGSQFVLKGDIVIGRHQGDLILRDSKVSGQHARIFKNSEGIFEIEDLGSSNGTFLNGTKIVRAPLKADDVIGIGRSLLKLEKHTHTGPPSIFEKGSWQETVAFALDKSIQAAEKLSPDEHRLSLPSMPLVLEVMQGFQLGERFALAYGSREIGGVGRDISIIETDCPDVLFEAVIKERGQWILRTKSEKLLFNGSTLAKDEEVVLSDGDFIQIGQTILKVGLPTQI